MNSSETKFSFKRLLYILFCGLCMGAADIVPGISGGTIAFIMGFYAELINSIKSFNINVLKKLIQRKFKEAFQTVSWEFLTALICGMAIAFLTLAPLFDYILGHEHYRVYLYATFLGLILASVILCGKHVEKWSWKYIGAFLFGALIAYVFTGSDFAPISEASLYDVEIALHVKSVRNYDPVTHRLLNVPDQTLSAMLANQIIKPDTIVYNQTKQVQGLVKEFVDGHVHLGINPWLIFCGALAISAMLLPGISGSYLLNILGVYPVVIGALADFVNGLMHFQIDFDAFMVLASMVIGIVAGALVFSRFISWLFKYYYQVAIAMLTGFMVGALRAVWPFWSYSYTLLPLKLEKGPQLQVVEPYLPYPTAELFQVACFCMLMGFGLVFAIEYLANWKQRKLTGQAR